MTGRACYHGDGCNGTGPECGPACGGCGGTGVVGVVSMDMARDGGQPERAGDPIWCWLCAGSGIGAAQNGAPA